MKCDGDLRKIVPDLDEEERLEAIRQISEAVRFAHEKMVVHKDLKPENFLYVEVDGSYEYKLADLGAAKVQNNELSMTQDGAGTFWYLAPERFNKGENWASKVDVWAMGLIFFEVMTEQHLFKNDEWDEA